MAETFIHISSSLQDKVPADPWAGNCCERFVGRGRVCFKAEEPWQSNANNCPIWLASAVSLKLFGSICGCWLFFLILFFFWKHYQYCGPRFNCLRGSCQLHAFFPLVPPNESISSPGTTSWSSFISFDSFSASSLPAAFSHQYRSAHATTKLNHSPLLLPLICACSWAGCGQ